MSNVIQLRPLHMHDPLLNYGQLANHLGVSERFIRARIAEGLPAGYDWSGRKRMFRLSEVEAWMREHRERTA